MENLNNFLFSLSTWIDGLSPDSNTEQMVFTLKLFDEQSMGIPINPENEREEKHNRSTYLKWNTSDKLSKLLTECLPSNSKSMARPDQNGVVGLNMIVIASDTIGSNGFRLTFTVKAIAFITNQIINHRIN